MYMYIHIIYNKVQYNYWYIHRSSILTGKYVHNHKTYENSVQEGCDAPSWRKLNEEKTIAAYMSKAGYQTGLFGTYILTTVLRSIFINLLFPQLQVNI